MKTRILVFGMTDILGGVETFIRNTYLNFDYNNFEVDFLHHSKNKILFEEDFKKNGSKIYRCEKFLSNPIKSLLTLKRIYNKGNYDIVHCNACSANMMIYFFPAIFMKKKPVLVMHSHNGSSNKKVRHYIFKFFLEKIVNIRYACSDIAGEWMFKKGKKYEIIPNGIITDDFKYNEEMRRIFRKKYKFNDDDIILGSVGRLEKVKNHQYIIKLLKKMDSKYKYVVVGDGSLKNDLNDVIKKMELEERVILVSNNNYIYNYYQMFDIFVMPSIFEGLPMVCIEAQMSGIPLILSDNISRDTKLSENVSFINLSMEGAWIKKIKEYGEIKINRGKINYKIVKDFDSRKVAERIGTDFLLSSKRN